LLSGEAACAARGDVPFLRINFHVPAPLSNQLLGKGKKEKKKEDDVPAASALLRNRPPLTVSKLPLLDGKS